MATEEWYDNFIPVTDEETRHNTNMTLDHEERIAKLEKQVSGLLRVIHLMIEADKLETV